MRRDVSRKLRRWKVQLLFYRSQIASSFSFVCLTIFIFLLITRQPSTTLYHSDLHQLTPKQLIRQSKSNSNSEPFPPIHKISVWYQAPCRGTFQSQPAPHSDIQFPYAIIRDATVDRRPVTRGVIHGCPSTSVRFTLYLSVHSSVELSKRDIQTVISHPDADLNVHYVLHATKFLLPEGGFEHAQRTQFGHVATEWHVGLCLSMSSTAALDPQKSNPLRLVVKDDARFNISMLVHRFDGEKIPVFFNMSLGCVQGWQTPGVARKSRCTAKSTSNARGAALFSGSALYGAKKRHAAFYREIAHFAIRALSGPVRYDAVVMSVVSDKTISDASFECGDSDECFERLRNTNNQLLDSIAGEVQHELRTLGAPESMSRKIIILSSCVLGSDAWRSELNDACNQTKHYGQYWATVFSYAPLAPFFKWATSNDMDEFFMPASNGPKALASRRADRILDAANENSEGNPREGSFVAQWLNFLIDTEEDARNLSRVVAKGRIPTLANKDDVSRSSECYNKLEDETGKSAVRCDVGYGFTVHSSIFVYKDDHGHINFTVGWRVNRDLRTWHARYYYSKGSCKYKYRAAESNINTRPLSALR